MLPNFSLLDLKERSVPMGEFYQLSQPEADELNKGDGHEPIMGAKYMAHGCQPGDEPTDDHECFETYRVWGRDPDSGRKHATLYTVYDAQALWSNLQAQRRNPQGYFDPKTRNPFWREDWYELHDRYDPDGPVPEKVAKLPRMAPDVAPGLEWPDTDPEDEWEEDWSSEEEDEEEEEDPDPVHDLGRLLSAIVVATDLPSRASYLSVAWEVTQLINRGSTDGDYAQYHSELLAEIDQSPNTQSWLLTAIRGRGSSDRPYPVKGQVLRLLAFYADTYTVRELMRDDDGPWTDNGRLNPLTALGFTAAVKEYMHHLETLPTIADNPSAELDYERDTRRQRLADARRVLHYMKWQDAVEDKWLRDPALPIVNAEDDTDAALNAPIGPVGMAKQLVFELSGLIVEGGLNEVGKPAQHHAVMVKIWELWCVFRDWRANNYQQSLRRRFPFGRQLVQLWALANYAQRKDSNEHTNPDFLNTGDSSEEEELRERIERYAWMTRLLVRTLWLSVSMFYVHDTPYGPFATDSEMMTFFYQYVAHFYTGNATGWALYEYDNDDTNQIEDANHDMREQWMEDRRGGPWDGPFGHISDAPTADRPYRGEGTPDPRRQRLR